MLELGSIGIGKFRAQHTTNCSWGATPTWLCPAEREEADPILLCPLTFDPFATLLQVSQDGDREGKAMGRRMRLILCSHRFSTVF